MRSMEFRTFQNQHSGRLPDGTKILFFDNFVEFKLISREKVSDHFVKYWICDRVNQLFSFYICWQCWRTVANSVFTIFQVISGWDQFERRTRTGTTTTTLGESRKTHIHYTYIYAGVLENIYCLHKHGMFWVSKNKDGSFWKLGLFFASKNKDDSFWKLIFPLQGCKRSPSSQCRALCFNTPFSPR